jgi:hypothetical protein
MSYDSWKQDTPPRNDDPIGTDFDRWLYAAEEVLSEAGIEATASDYPYLYDKFRDGYTPQGAAAILVKERT